MNWQKVDNYHFKSEEGYKIAGFIVDGVEIFRAFSPDENAIGSTYTKCSLAKKACEEHFNEKN